MGHYEYLAILGLCLVATVPLEFLYGFKVWRDPLRLVNVVFPGFVVFTTWDAFAVKHGHWAYNPASITGVHVGNIPIEELLFFIVIPACAISGFEAVKAGLSGVVPFRRKTRDDA